MNDCEEIQPLLMGLMDHELTPEESALVNDHLGRCPQCRESYEQLRETSVKLDSVSLVEPTDEVLATLWRSPFSRLARNSGLIMVVGGYLALLLFGLYELLTDGKEALFFKICLGSIVIGFLLLLVLVIRERISTYKHDPYKHIQR